MKEPKENRLSPVKLLCSTAHGNTERRRLTLCFMMIKARVASGEEQGVLCHVPDIPTSEEDLIHGSLQGLNEQEQVGLYAGCQEHSMLCHSSG